MICGVGLGPGDGHHLGPGDAGGGGLDRADLEVVGAHLGRGVAALLDPVEGVGRGAEAELVVLVQRPPGPARSRTWKANKEIVQDRTSLTLRAL